MSAAEAVLPHCPGHFASTILTRCRWRLNLALELVLPPIDMRALAAAIALSLLTIAALAASPQVEAALNAFRTVGTDANRLKTFCELMEIEEENQEKAAPSVEAKLDKMLDELGADFKAAWKSVEDIDPASDDGTVLYAALDRLLEKCSG